ncbi:MAG: NUDIX domain-containing protein [Pseudomonadota bacterium]
MPRLIHRVRGVIRPPVTLGAQLFIVDDDGCTLLVKPRYAPRWQFPGGGVDPGETAREAALRETFEETGLAVRGDAEFWGLYFNAGLNRRDHVALFVCRNHPPLRDQQLRGASAEIADILVAPLAEPPDNLSSGTRRRMAELSSGVRSERW